jgi:hypothetical protein
MRRNTKAVARTSSWLGKLSSAFSKEQESEDDAKFYRREKVGDRIKKCGIKMGAKFTGHVGNDKQLSKKDEYTVSGIDTTKNVVILKGKKDSKTRRVSVLNKIFG